MATDTQAQQNALREKRTDDLQAAAAARRAGDPASARADLTKARTVGTEIRTNATANNAAAAAPTTGTQTPTGTAPVTAANPTGAQTPTTISTPPSASAIIADVVNSIPGLSLVDPSGIFAAWITGQVNAMNQTNTSAADMVSSLQATINNPGASGDTQAQQVFDQLFPGYNQRIQQTGNNGGGLGAYLSYSTQIQSFAQTAQLPAGTVNNQTIGSMWGADVSASEVSDRITSAYVAATNTPPAVQDYLKNTYGIGPGGIAGYYLNPTNALASLNNVNAGIAGIETGFGSLSQSQAATLTAFMQPSSSSGVQPIAVSDVNNRLTGALGGGVVGSAAQLAAGGFEGTAPGQSSTGTVSQDTLLAGVEGNAAALQQTEHAQEARTAGSKGGGGVSASSAGTGIGFASSS